MSLEDLEIKKAVAAVQTELNRQKDKNGRLGADNLRLCEEVRLLEKVMRQIAKPPDPTTNSTMTLQATCCLDLLDDIRKQAKGKR